MNFFHNSEIKKSFLFYLFVTLLFMSAGFFIGRFWETTNANVSLSFLLCLCSLLLCLFFLVLHFLFTYSRYRQLHRLSYELDRILHGADTLHFSDYKEGELSILKIEIDKLLLCLRAQQETLKQDKIFLAASMADISHQIRTPLTSIHLILSLLTDSELSPLRRQKLIRQLSILISRIDWQIEALLKLSKLDAGTVDLTLQVLPLSRVVKEAAASLEIPMELREQTFSLTGQTEAALSCDMTWTAEAITNILKNCMEHTPKGGHICACISDNGIFTELKIEDDGPGFLPKDIPHLFERFYKGENSGEQSIGIGLALAKMILTRQNATIKAENRPTGGARFLIHFYKK